MNTSELTHDLTPFADIGTNRPKILSDGSDLVAQFTRDGRIMKVTINKISGKTQLLKTGFPVKNFASLSSLYASDDFANLRRWADTQGELLRREATDTNKLLPINGLTHKGIRVQGIEAIDRLVGTEAREADAAEVLLIDGPAGIGKTNLIEQVALARALSYRVASKPLILHVRSRGRVLSNLQDVMAFSLQTIRSNTTYDQIPILVKHGLIIVAVDGFDELGDPNGYELAWSQVNELISLSRGLGTIILSGRDTFLGRDRLFRDVQSLRRDIDIVTGITLDAPSAEQAKTWLRTKNWTDVHFESPAVSSLLEDGSFALRPVFLTLFADHIRPKELREATDTYLTPLLVDHILRREATLFGKNVEAVISREEIKNLLLRILIEVARDMADSQIDAIDDATLGLILETTYNSHLTDEVRRLIRNRVGVLAFFKPDQRQGFKAFIHSHLQNYFLSLATIQSLSIGELPKFIRRNLLGSDFLAVFVDVAAKVSDKPELDGFLHRSLNSFATGASFDRTNRNLGALLLASLPNLGDGTVLSDYEIDEAVVRGTSGRVKLAGVTVHQLDCRNADLSHTDFENCNVVSLIANDGARFSPSFPIPKYLYTETNPEGTSEAIEDWLRKRGRNAASSVTTGIASTQLQSHPIYQLLGRVCRIRHYWLRAGDDIQADKILRDPNWPTLAGALRDCGLLREEQRQASGSSSTFTHVRQREQILAETPDHEAIAKLFLQLDQLIND